MIRIAYYNRGKKGSIGLFKNDVFLNPQTAKPDWSYYFGIFIVVALIFVGIFLAFVQFQQFALSYIVLAGIATILGLTAITTKSKYVGEVIYGLVKTDSQVVIHSIVGLAYGGVILAALFFGISLAQYFAISLPTQLLSLPFNPYIIIFLFSVIIVEVEEMFRTSTLLPTAMKSIASGALFVSLIIFGIVLFFIAYWAPLIGAIFVVLGIAFAARKDFRKFVVRSKVDRILIPTLFVDFLFAIYHLGTYSVYTNTTILIVSAFLFAFGSDLINQIMGSAIPSRMGHSLYNGISTAKQLGGKWEYYVVAVASTGIYFFAIFMIRRASNLFKGIVPKRNLNSSVGV